MNADTDEQRLATALAASWDRETASVYADLLTARGDPRGELIAIDLVEDPPYELVARKSELLDRWPGREALVRWEWTARNFRRGLLRRHDESGGPDTSDDLPDRLREILDAVGPYVADLGIWGNHDAVRESLEEIARRGLPWLQSLRIERIDATGPISLATWERFVGATPNLRDLQIIGDEVLRTPIHPNVTALRLLGTRGLVITAEPVANVTALELTFHSADRRREMPPEASVPMAALVNPRTFPSLRTLDLSPNEPLSWTTPQESDAVLPFVRAVETLEHFERLRIPSVRDDDAARNWFEILERHPQLEIEVARMFGRINVRHPRLRVPAPRPWPASANSRDALTIELPDGTRTTELALSDLIEDLEDEFDDMFPSAQNAWRAFWAFVDNLPWENEWAAKTDRPFSAHLLRIAVEALPINRRATEVARSLRQAPLMWDSDVRIARYWGW